MRAAPVSLGVISILRQLMDLLQASAPTLMGTTLLASRRRGKVQQEHSTLKWSRVCCGPITRAVHWVLGLFNFFCLELNKPCLGLSQATVLQVDQWH